MFEPGWRWTKNPCLPLKISFWSGLSVEIHLGAVKRGNSFKPLFLWAPKRTGVILESLVVFEAVQSNTPILFFQTYLQFATGMLASLGLLAPRSWFASQERDFEAAESIQKISILQDSLVFSYQVWLFRRYLKWNFLKILLCRSLGVWGQNLWCVSLQEAG